MTCHHPPENYVQSITLWSFFSSFTIAWVAVIAQIHCWMASTFNCWSVLNQNLPIRLWKPFAAITIWETLEVAAVLKVVSYRGNALRGYSLKTHLIHSLPLPLSPLPSLTTDFVLKSIGVEVRLRFVFRFPLLLPFCFETRTISLHNWISLCPPGWLIIHYVAQAGLELATTSLSQSSNC